MAEAFKIVEVGPRDGLQNEPQQVATATKLELIRQLVDCGLPVIEATSFVSPKWVPQMADADAVLAGIAQHAGVHYPVLVPNLQGLERARAAGVQEIAVFTAASSAFTQKNINASVEESLARLAPVIEQALTAGIRVRGYVSTALGCPYQGEVALSEVVRVTRVLADAGCYEISLGDTIGVGTPKKARAMLMACADTVGMDRLAVHFHDTYGQALANIFACVEAGVRVADASVSGLGGCPYAKGASGNVATEDLVYMLQGMGFDTGVDLQKLVATSRWISAQLRRQPASKLARQESERSTSA